MFSTGGEGARRKAEAESRDLGTNVWAERAEGQVHTIHRRSGWPGTSSLPQAAFSSAPAQLAASAATVLPKVAESSGTQSWLSDQESAASPSCAAAVVSCLQSRR